MTKLDVSRAGENDVRAMGRGLRVGQSHRGLCPWCDGGGSRELSFNVTRYEDGLGIYYTGRKWRIVWRGRNLL